MIDSLPSADLDTFRTSTVRLCSLSFELENVLYPSRQYDLYPSRQYEVGSGARMEVNILGQHSLFRNAIFCSRNLLPIGRRNETCNYKLLEK